MKKSKLIIAKAGTNFLHPNVFEDMASETAQLFKQEIFVVWVSSGAVRFGRMRYLNMPGKEFLPNEKREAAGLGARHLLNAWGNAFEPYDMDVAQVWVTYEPDGLILNASDIKEMIMFYIAHGIVPIINYNDVVSGKELELGDNDHLAVEIAQLINADSLIFFTEKGGVYHNTLPLRYKEINATDYPTCTQEISSSGTGGMSSKLKEAVRFHANGTRRVSIAGVDEKDTLIRFAHNESVGTMIGKLNRI